MKTTKHLPLWAIMGILLLVSRPCLAQYTLTYTTNGSAVTLYEYSGLLTNLTVPSFVNIIGPGALQGDMALTNVTIPTSVTNIGAAAFNNCHNLASITLLPGNPALASSNGVIFNSNFTEIIVYPEGLTNTAYTIPNGVNNIAGSAFQGAVLTSVSFPATLTNIGAYAFAFTSLQSIVIPNGVVSLGDGAFSGCDELSTLGLPATATNIAPDVASSCASLVSITVNPLNPAYAAVAGVLFNHNLTTLLQYPSGKSDGQYQIPIGVTNIAQDAFFETQVTNILLPPSLTTIPDAAFNAAWNLISMTIPPTVTNIGPTAFWQCSALTTVYFSSNVVSISSAAFEYDTALTWVFFEGNAPSADCTTFAGDSNLSAVYYLPGTTNWGTTFACLPAVNWGVPAPRITGAGAVLDPSGQFSFSLTGSSNAIVSVQASTDLVDWTTIGTATLNSGSGAFVDPAASTYSNRFYRLHIP